jgi:hypothetical protein
MQPLHIFERFLECRMQPLHIFKGWRSILFHLFEVSEMPDATLTDFRRVEVDYLTFLRFLGCRMQPLHIFEGSKSILLNPFKVSGMPDATITYFRGVKVDFPLFFKDLLFMCSLCSPYVLLMYS